MTVSRSVVLWATPIAFVIHNAEEAWAFPRYAARVRAYLPEALRAAPISIAGLETALIAVTAAFLAIAVWATMRPESAVAIWTALLVPAVGALNALAHIASAAFLLHGYSPGLVTALCLLAPLSGLVLRRAWREHWLSAGRWRLLALGAVLLHGPVLLAVLRVAIAG